MSASIPIHRGMTYGYYARNGYYGSAAAKTDVDRMATLNIDWVCLVVTVMQDTFASTRMYRDFAQTPGEDEIMGIVDYIHSKGMKVQLRPMLECWDGTQRVHIRFPAENLIIPGRPINHWTRWFDSLAERTLHYGRLAQKTGCEAFGLDSELDHTVGQQEHWLRVISAARSVYKGHLTTGHTRQVDFRAELRTREDHWFKQLDSLGSSFYTPLADAPNATDGQMRAKILPDVEYYREVAALLGKPFYFAEAGCCATAGALMKPWGWDNNGGYNGAEQARFLEILLGAFWQEPWWMGLYWWKWDEQNDRPWLRDDPRGDKGFTVWNKPAAEVMRRWYGRQDR
ncbi:hypothetical protein OH491_22280 [Termitidicoccus mucosus]